MQHGASTQTTRPLRRAKPKQVTDEKPDLSYQKNIDNLLSILLLQRGLRDRLANVPLEAFPEGNSRQLLEFLLDNPDFNGAKDPAAKEMKKFAEYVKMLGLQYEETYENVDDVDLNRAAATLEQKIIKTYVMKRKAEITSQLPDDEENPESRRLMREMNELNSLLNHNKGAY
jgi:hypothetical protein